MRIPTMLSMAFPLRSKDSFSIFVRIKSSNPFILCQAIDQFMAGVYMLEKEGEFLEILWEPFLSKTFVKVAPLDDSCLVLIDLGPTEVGNFLEEQLDEFFKTISKVKPHICAEIGLGRTLHEMLAFVGLD